MKKRYLLIWIATLLVLAGCQKITTTPSKPILQTGTIQKTGEITQITSGQILTGNIANTGNTITTWNTTKGTGTLIPNTGTIQTQNPVSQQISGNVSSGTNKKLLEAKLKTMIEKRKQEISKTKVETGLSEEDIKVIENILDEVVGKK